MSTISELNIENLPQFQITFDLWRLNDLTLSEIVTSGLINGRILGPYIADELDRLRRQSGLPIYLADRLILIEAAERYSFDVGSRNSMVNFAIEIADKAIELTDKSYDEKVEWKLHARRVVNITSTWCNDWHYIGMKIQAAVAAALHDVVEDTPITLEDLANYFPEPVIHTVDMLSDPPGLSRKERKKLWREKWISKCDSIIAPIIKVADRVDNINRSLNNKQDKFIQMYYNEDKEFREIIGHVRGWSLSGQMTVKYNRLIDQCKKHLEK